ncbi:Uncharacterized protein dnl_09520 [Desulfonema limicola]|uniref:Uncharacterized protein n=1 Tax=Desulfonema limicola TaxID=45656 RepID=A0A975GF20_9BACT|nr:hypothetical protein [Desulfonema limicola]QTA78720.1 Uncharacterized protein dnl_09520 [Desulfonema limicola]
MKHFLISAAGFTGIVFLYLFDRLLDKLPSWSQSVLKYIIIAGIFAVVGDTLCKMFYRPSFDEIAAKRIDLFLSRVGNAGVTDDNCENVSEQ